MRVVVIGAGVIGCALACELARRGADVTMCERRAPGAGTSTTSFAWVNANNKPPRAYHDLNVAGMAAHRALQAAPHPGPSWFFPTGNLEWATDTQHAEQLAGRLERLTAWAYPTRRLRRQEALALEPDLRVPQSAELIALFTDEGFALPALLLGRLLGEARELGTRLVAPATVEHVEADASGAAVHLDDGERLRGDAVVCCAGRWTTPLLARAGYRVPLLDADAADPATAGYLAWTAPLPARVGRLVTTPGLDMRPDGGGRLVLQGIDCNDSADPHDPPAPDGPVAEELRARLARVVTGGEHAEVETIKVGQRPMPLDGFTICGHLDDDSRLYVVATHSGVTLGPLLGRLATEEIVTGELDPRLAPFRPGRFADV